MPVKQTLNKTEPPVVETTSNNGDGGQPKKGTPRNKLGNLLLRLITADMYLTPHPLEFTNEFDSREFCLEKGYRLLLEPLEFQSEKQWLDYAREVWEWNESQELRRKESIVRDILATYQNDDDIMKMLKEQIDDAIAA